MGSKNKNKKPSGYNPPQNWPWKAEWKNKQKNRFLHPNKQNEWGDPLLLGHCILMVGPADARILWSAAAADDQQVFHHLDQSINFCQAGMATHWSKCIQSLLNHPKFDQLIANFIQCSAFTKCGKMHQKHTGTHVSSSKKKRGEIALEHFKNAYAETQPECRNCGVNRC